MKLLLFPNELRGGRFSVKSFVMYRETNYVNLVAAVHDDGYRVLAKDFNIGIWKDTTQYTPKETT